MSDSDDGLENWQNQLYEVHGHRCERITKYLRCLSAHAKDFPTYDGLIDPGKFIAQFSEQVPESQRIQTLEAVLRATVVRWWKGHRKYIHSWEACQKFLRLKFIDQSHEVRSKFNGQNSP